MTLTAQEQVYVRNGCLYDAVKSVTNRIVGITGADALEYIYCEMPEARIETEGAYKNQNQMRGEMNLQKIIREGSALGRRIIDKPSGYAGDWLTINMLYQAEVQTDVDAFLHDSSAAKAVRNRRSLLAQAIAPARRVTSLACGPAAEIFDVLSGGIKHPSLGSRLFTCVDKDASALSHVCERRNNEGYIDSIHAVRMDLAKMACGGPLPSTEQDVVYTIGLIDYFSDRLVIKLIDRMWDMLSPGGVCIVGNFVPGNSSQWLMEEVLDWRLRLRNEDHMKELFAQTRFGKVSRFEFEGEGVNLFAFGVR
jgi:extracellular factor (EF) 3-hydroxypalmitic acid methyl ester biosynthesis protein